MNDRRQAEGLSSAGTDITSTGLVVISEGDRSQDDMPGNRRTVSIFKICNIVPRNCKNKRSFRVDEKIFA